MPSLHSVIVSNGSPIEDVNLSVHRKGELSLSAKPLELNQVVSGHVHHVMRGVTDDYNPSLHNVGMAYFLCMVLIGVIAITGQLIVQVFVSASFHDSRLVNIAGMQRMYNQRIAKSSLALLLFNNSSQDFITYKDELQNTLSSLKEGYTSLRDGNIMLQIPRNDNAHRIRMFNDSNPYFESVVQTATSILNTIKANSPTLVVELIPKVQGILNNGTKLSIYLNDIVTSYTNDANRHLKTVLKITWSFTSVLLLIIVVEGIFVIRPIIVRLQTLMLERFDLLRAGLEAEASARSVSMITVKYVGHEVKEPLAAIMRTIKTTGRVIRSVINSLESKQSMEESATLPSSTTFLPSSISASILFSCQSVLQSLAKAQENCRLMATVVDDVDDICMLERGQIKLKRSNIRVKELIKHVFETVEEINKSIELKYQPIENIENVFFVSDEHRVTQVLINLVSNAMRFMQKGTVTVSISSPRNGFIKFEVIDTGSGLSEEDCAKVLQPFSGTSVTEAALEGGRGLGLYICKLLVELLGGILGVSSVLGEGTTFWFQLPFKPPPLQFETSPPENNAVSNSSSSTRRHSSPNNSDSISSTSFISEGSRSINLSFGHSILASREDGSMEKKTRYKGSDASELFDPDTSMLRSIEEGCHRGGRFMLVLSEHGDGSVNMNTVVEDGPKGGDKSSHQREKKRG